mmetsp:Transcript_21162/g.49175  ORF Transcript_21162/g.49175 Transcript_21162/m.49175 type:complete len:156 (+) Transcript_21162:564-1031(+)
MGPCCSSSSEHMTRPTNEFRCPRQDLASQATVPRSYLAARECTLQQLACLRTVAAVGSVIVRRPCAEDVVSRKKDPGAVGTARSHSTNFADLLPLTATAALHAMESPLVPRNTPLLQRPALLPLVADHTGWGSTTLSAAAKRPSMTWRRASHNRW